MTFVTRVAKKTCDSQRMGKREAVTETGAVIQPVASRLHSKILTWLSSKRLQESVPTNMAKDLPSV